MSTIEHHQLQRLYSHERQINMLLHAGPFIVWNEPNEAALLKKWFEHMREV